MFGQKINSWLGNAFTNTTDFLGNAYTKTKHALGVADDIFSKFKNVYNKVQPALQDAAPEKLRDTFGKIDQGIKQGMEGYGNIREKIDHADKKITETSHKIMNAAPPGMMGAYLKPM